eukprot:GILK01001629.1.p2 GENE.GILK01001629.1~~GILK01001629.1.p2  ORF type:complete len:139 (-),score=40.43 GILK01001629.1:98-514(-)
MAEQSTGKKTIREGYCILRDDNNHVKRRIKLHPNDTEWRAAMKEEEVPLVAAGSAEGVAMADRPTAEEEEEEEEKMELDLSEEDKKLQESIHKIMESADLESITVRKIKEDLRKEYGDALVDAKKDVIKKIVDHKLVS